MSTPQRIEVGILGATGVVGQQFIRLLAEHPWFDLTWLAASERSASRTYAQAAAWRLATPCPERVTSMPVSECLAGGGPRVLFSALDADAAQTIEPALAAAGHIIVSNTKSMRMDPVVPLLIPEVNPEHLGILKRQRRNAVGAVQS